MRLDKIIESWNAEEEKQNSNVVIYDPEAPGEQEAPEGASGVVFFLPDNGRDRANP